MNVNLNVSNKISPYNFNNSIDFHLRCYLKQLILCDWARHENEKTINFEPPL